MLARLREGENISSIFWLDIRQFDILSFSGIHWIFCAHSELLEQMNGYTPKKTHTFGKNGKSSTKGFLCSEHLRITQSLKLQFKRLLSFPFNFVKSSTRYTIPACLLVYSVFRLFHQLAPRDYILGVFFFFTSLAFVARVYICSVSA